MEHVWTVKFIIAHEFGQRHRLLVSMAITPIQLSLRPRALSLSFFFFTIKPDLGNPFFEFRLHHLESLASIARDFGMRRAGGSAWLTAAVILKDEKC